MLISNHFTVPIDANNPSINIESNSEHDWFVNEAKTWRSTTSLKELIPETLWVSATSFRRIFPSPLGMTTPIGCKTRRASYWSPILHPMASLWNNLAMSRYSFENCFRVAIFLVRFSWPWLQYYPRFVARFKFHYCYYNFFLLSRSVWMIIFFNTKTTPPPTTKKNKFFFSFTKIGERFPSDVFGIPSRIFRDFVFVPRDIKTYLGFFWDPPRCWILLNETLLCHLWLFVDQ